MGSKVDQPGDSGTPRELSGGGAPSSLHVAIVTGDRLVYDGLVETVVVPGVLGQLAVRPHHAPLLAALDPGELVVRGGGREESFAVSGGFIEVLDDEVTVLADTAERAEEIDVARAEAARRRARILVRRFRGHPDVAAAQRALRRSRARLRVARRQSARTPGRR